MAGMVYKLYAFTPSRRKPYIDALHNMVVMAKDKSYVVVYRQGGYARFRWFATMLYSVEADAYEVLKDVRKMGYYAMINVADIKTGLPLHGMPETFGPKDSAGDVKALGNGWFKQNNCHDIK
jgi:hypothetical protein